MEVNEDNVLVRNVLVEFEDSLKYASYLDDSEGSSSRHKFSSKFNHKVDSRIILTKLISKYPPDIEASVLLKILRGHWKAYLIEKPSLELCRHLVSNIVIIVNIMISIILAVVIIFVIY